MTERTVTLEQAEIDFLTDAIRSVNNTNLLNGILLTQQEQKMVVALIKKFNTR